MAELDAGQCAFFAEHGYAVVEDAVDSALLAELRRDFDRWVEESRRHGDPPTLTTTPGRHSAFGAGELCSASSLQSRV